MLVHDRIPDFVPRCVGAHSHSHRRLTVAVVYDRRVLSLHFIKNLLRLGRPAMNEQPARALRNPAPKENHDEPKRRADSESESPAKPDREPTWIEEHDRCRRTHRSPNPVRAVNHQIYPATNARWNQFINR